MKSAAAIIVAAGRSKRMGRLGDKIWIRIAGRPVLFYSVAAFLKAGVQRIIIAVKPGAVNTTRIRIRRFFGRAAGSIDVVDGGRERQDSVWNGIAAAGTDFVLVHDAARPAVTADLIRDIFRQTRVHGACVPVVPVSDTLKRVEGGFVRKTASREGLYGVQTPQGFRRQVLREAIVRARRRGLAATDCSALVEHLGKKVVVTPGDSGNIKLTRPEDLKLLRAILRATRKNSIFNL